MAKVKSLFNVEGTLGEVTFYKDQDGYKIRTKNGVSKERIMSDPAYARTRENLTEFGNTARSGKMLRRSIVSLMNDAKDNRVTSRLTQIMSKVKNEDLTSVRGQRNVATGILTAEGKAWLKGFNFNKRAILDAVLQSTYTLNTTTGEVSIADLVPIQQLAYPEGATHVEFSSGFLNLDFLTGDKDLQLSNLVNLPVDATVSTITLTPLGVPTGSGQNFYFLKAAFFQEINGVQYPLNNGAFNALQLLEVI
ncbi:hypothetical protein KO494_08565 [Lacinutrix sp. C3R15]|uniref:hypothetical protein n=1 Tax=Flavobacteriaceae TaxID=49546 RepID=UPI001C0A2CBB|nr:MULTISPECIES: hypothetical protein [Flavobacteriaceae]MBU2939593.1 hypothetical protein [Lacinutrix sp. C3R15]MDO6622907.1 hypothetical protein [Oceanihabitans sp. 1_MG-2023]